MVRQDAQKVALKRRPYITYTHPMRGRYTDLERGLVCTEGLQRDVGQSLDVGVGFGVG